MVERSYVSLRNSESEYVAVSIGYLTGSGVIIHGQKPSPSLTHHVSNVMSKEFLMKKPNSTWSFLGKKRNENLMHLELLRVNIELCGKIFVVNVNSDNGKKAYDVCVVLGVESDIAVESDFQCVCKKIETIVSEKIPGDKLSELKESGRKLLISYRKQVEAKLEIINLLLYPAESIRGKERDSILMNKEIETYVDPEINDTVTKSMTMNSIENVCTSTEGINYDKTNKNDNKRKLKETNQNIVEIVNKKNKKDIVSIGKKESKKNKKKTNTIGIEIEINKNSSQKCDVIYGYEVGNRVLSMQGVVDDNDKAVISNTEGIVTRSVRGRRDDLSCDVTWNEKSKGSNYKPKIKANSRYDIYIPTV
jgi:hypothetical protein